MRQGDAIDPFHLGNGFEAVIGYECQERSNHPFSQRRYNAGVAGQGVAMQVSGCGGEWGGGRMETYDGPAFTRLSLCRSSLGVVLGDLVDVAAWGIVPCVSKIESTRSPTFLAYTVNSPPPTHLLCNKLHVLYVSYE